MTQTIDVDAMRPDLSIMSPIKENIHIRRSRFSLQSSKVTIKNRQEPCSDENIISNIATLDT
jgi:hypothetical protein